MERVQSAALAPTVKQRMPLFALIAFGPIQHTKLEAPADQIVTHVRYSIFKKILLSGIIYGIHLVLY